MLKTENTPHHVMTNFQPMLVRDLTMAKGRLEDWASVSQKRQIIDS